ncbi:glycerol-3-phosphate dehydrogenase (NAD(P)+) [Rhizobium sp. PP-F2F-G48]|uniref:2-dehydropantoate 2-reductase N-terminal domain-containing protein n=1 Tax=Rhizobium sp. PP-F2F-G48 TaxID=2135651 RepID=UPI0010440012|nr:2-dehydropantoate 2-reductase N-terminal domain-containing protein [Rhizobium sp. PP-F2F-G48]TCM52696.1 glycerol-3-phosphate dehydrogenase (NAD(P)+) [Rhizobium sp. PP-F2F-G48]
MAHILILGAGVMGTALAVPASDNGHDVVLAGTPLDAATIARMQAPAGTHPKLDAPLATSVRVLADDALTAAEADRADLVVVGVSSPGIAWAVERLNGLLRRQTTIAFVTKGLDRRDDAVVTFAETVPARIARLGTFIGIGGPCIARELALRLPTSSVYAAREMRDAERVAALFRTPYYRLAASDDLTGVEACAALKNFFAIGVSAMQTRYPDTLRADGQSKNPTAAAFTQAVQEMAALCALIGGRRQTAFDLAGLGDLHVTVGGGRNSRLGHSLGRDRTVAEVVTQELANETVEGIDTARVVAALLETAANATPAFPLAFPLAQAIVTAVLNDTRFDFDFATLHA